MQIEHKKNTAYYLSFPAVDSSTPQSFKSGVSPVDTAYYKDGAGAWTSLAIADTATEIGSTGLYEIDLSASELNHDQVVIKFSVSGMADTAFMFDMRTKLVDDLNDVSTADVNAQCDTAISDAALATAAALAAVDANVDAILVDTSTTLPGTLATIDTNVDSILVDTGTLIPATITSLPSNTRIEMDANSSQLAAIVADTSEVQTAWADGGRLDLIIDAILEDTTSTIPGQVAALNNISVADILTTQMTESYAADGAAPTLAQALCLIQQMLGDFAISGTTLTVKKVDGATTAATFTLDDGTSPTSITRAT